MFEAWGFSGARCLGVKGFNKTWRTGLGVSGEGGLGSTGARGSTLVGFRRFSKE